MSPYVCSAGFGPFIGEAMSVHSYTALDGHIATFDAAKAEGPWRHGRLIVYRSGDGHWIYRHDTSGPNKLKHPLNKAFFANRVREELPGMGVRILQPQRKAVAQIPCSRHRGRPRLDQSPNPPAEKNPATNWMSTP